MVTDAAQQALTKDRLQCGRNKKRLHAHIDQARNCTRRIIRMQCRKDQMPRERRLNSNLRRLEIARLANHNAVGVLAQEVPQHAREG
jgi:hypothetical protein